MTFICGVDEAGRGPLCGPVFASAVILDNNLKIKNLDDSKKISPKKFLLKIIGLKPKNLKNLSGEI